MRNKSPTSKSKRAKRTANGDLTLCLYVAGNAPNSQMAVSNLTAICEQYLVGRCQLEIVDVLTSPQYRERLRASSVGTNSRENSDSFQGKISGKSVDSQLLCPKCLSANQHQTTTKG